MVYVTARAGRNGSTVAATMANGLMAKQADRGNCITQMAMSMRANGRMIKQPAMVPTRMLTAPSTLVSGMRTSSMGMG